MEYKKINLGCNVRKKAGFINVDLDPNVNPDVVMNLTKFPYPFDQDSVSEIYARSILEHVEKKYLAKIMDELYRICIDGAKITIITPHFTCNVSKSIIDHLNDTFAYETFECFWNYGETSKKNGLYKSSTVLKPVKITLHFHKSLGQPWNYFVEWFANKYPLIWEGTFLRVFPAASIEYVFKVIKK